MTLRVPAIPEDADLLQAALLYAACGWYVGPLLPKSKNPGSVLGTGWHHKSSRDPEQVVEWLAGTSVGGLFLHCGRSGAVIFDVDRPANVPEFLAKHLWDDDGNALVPFQSTRVDGADDPRRGHYLLLQPPDRMLGNGRGDLGDSWGEIRGANGVIVAEPTIHVEADGLYRWQTNGDVPPIPTDISARLGESTVVDAADDATVEKFFAEHTTSTKSAVMKAALAEYTTMTSLGASRHDTCVRVACWLMREAYQGFYPAGLARQGLWELFEASLAGTPRRWPKSEFQSIVAFAVGQALMTDASKRSEETWDRLAEHDRKRREAPPAPLGGAVATDPDKYFLDKTIGLDVMLLADDVLALGPLALGRDGHFWSYEDGVWTRDKKVVRRRAVHLLGRRYRQSHAGNVVDAVEFRLPVITCEPVEGFWNVRNGMLNWRTGELVTHSPDFYSTVQFPWDWEPDATCPQFDAFLAQILSPDYQVLAWQMIAYLLYSGNPMQSAFLLHGTGDNGKGTLLRLLSMMLGARNYSSETLNSLNGNKFAAITLFGMIANIAGDMDATFQTETAMFKSLTGEDNISAEHKYGERFMFSSWAVPVFTVNKIPGSADTTKGYMRRWQVIKFNYEIPPEEKVLGFSDRLVAEIPGIAVKALGVLRELMKTKRFKDDGDIVQGQHEFALAVDQVQQWVEEATIPAPDNAEPRSELYKSYRTWATSNGVGALRSHEFYARLESAGFPAGKSNGLRTHRGLRVMELRMIGEKYEPTKDSWTGEELTSD